MRNALLYGVVLMLLLVPSSARKNPRIAGVGPTIFFQEQALGSRPQFVNPSHRWPRDLLAIQMLGEEITFDANKIFGDEDESFAASQLVAEVLVSDNAYARMTYEDVRHFADAYLLHEISHQRIEGQTLEIYDETARMSKPYSEALLKRYRQNQRFRLRRSLEYRTRVEFIPEPPRIVPPFIYQRNEGNWVQVEGSRDPFWSHPIYLALQAFEGHAWPGLNTVLDRLNSRRFEMYGHPRLNVPEETLIDRKNGVVRMPIKSRLSEKDFEQAKFGAVLKGIIDLFDGGEPGLEKDLRTYARLWAVWTSNSGADIVNAALARMQPGENMVAVAFRKIENRYQIFRAVHTLSRGAFIEFRPDLVNEYLQKAFDWIDKYQPDLRYSLGRSA